VLGQEAARSNVAPGLIANLSQDLVAHHGASAGVAQAQASALVLGQLTREASVMAFQDVFLAAGVLMLFGIIPMLFMTRNPHTASQHVEVAVD
jgi:MFS-type transporter involved in bile tolerance (Atg22 family)